MTWIKELFRSVRRSKKPPWLFAIRDRIAYQALLTSRGAAALSFIAVCINAVVAYVAITSLNLNSQSAKQSQESAKSQVELNRQLADAATKQAEASVAAAKTSQDALTASQRAWVGPTDANIVAPVAYAPLRATILFGNSGRQPAPTYATLVPKIYSLDEWNNGNAVADIEKAKAECLALPMSSQGVRITFPTTGFNTFQIKYDGTQQSLRDVQKLSVRPNLVEGKEVVAFKGCFVYQTSGQVHRTSFCYFYQAKVSEPAHLNFCTVGQAAD
jgi:hypothetical protein